MTDSKAAPIETALTTIDRPSGGWALAVNDMRERMAAIFELYQGVMTKDTDYGIIPGTPKPSLYQSGAQMLDMLVGAYPTFEELPGTVRDWGAGFFYFEIRCRLLSKATGEVLAEGIGSCNSREKKYSGRWVFESELPGHLDKPTLKKREGISKKGNKYVQYLAPNDEIADLVNTLTKMAEKRAHVCATLNATGASRIFTQDVEDIAPEATETKPVAQAPRPVPAQAPEPTPPPASENPPVPTATPQGSALEDWTAEINRAHTLAELDAVAARIRAATMLTAEMREALKPIYKDRKADIEAAALTPQMGV